MANNTSLTARVYGLKAGDYQLVNEWWMARKGRPFLETLLPPLGVFAERDGVPVAVMWAYESVGIGVAFLEYFVTRPGQSFATTDRGFACCLAGITHILQQRGYSVLRGIIEDRFVPFARKHGFQGDGGFHNVIKSF